MLSLTPTPTLPLQGEGSNSPSLVGRGQGVGGRTRKLRPIPATPDCILSSTQNVEEPNFLPLVGGEGVDLFILPNFHPLSGFSLGGKKNSIKKSINREF